VINNSTYPILEAAYLYYYATEAGLQTGDNQDEGVKQRLMALIGDALIIANEAKFDVFNALTLMDNVPILEDLKVFVFWFFSYSLPRSYYSCQFGVGDGYLNFYLYNWRTANLAGMSSECSIPAGKGVGVIML
jgi:glycylpeptide N-tetradecanoyltransferase